MKNHKNLIMFTCPDCETEFFGNVDLRLDANLRRHFPATYGKNKLLCDDCINLRLETIKEKSMLEE